MAELGYIPEVSFFAVESLEITIVSLIVALESIAFFVVSLRMIVSFGMVIGIELPRKWGFLPKRMSRTALVRASFSRKYMRMRQILEMVFLALKATALIPRWLQMYVRNAFGNEVVFHVLRLVVGLVVVVAADKDYLDLSCFVEVYRGFDAVDIVDVRPACTAKRAGA